MLPGRAHVLGEWERKSRSEPVAARGRHGSRTQHPPEGGGGTGPGLEGEGFSRVDAHGPPLISGSRPPPSPGGGRTPYPRDKSLHHTLRTCVCVCVWFFGLGTPKRGKLQGGGKPRLRGLSRPKRHSLNGEPRRPNKPSDPHRITHYKDVYGYIYIYICMYIYIYICLPTPLEMGSSQSRPPTALFKFATKCCGEVHTTCIAEALGPRRNPTSLAWTWVWGLP